MVINRRAPKVNVEVCVAIGDRHEAIKANTARAISEIIGRPNVVLQVKIANNFWATQEFAEPCVRDFKTDDVAYSLFTGGLIVISPVAEIPFCVVRVLHLDVDDCERIVRPYKLSDFANCKVLRYDHVELVLTIIETGFIFKKIGVGVLVLIVMVFKCGVRNRGLVVAIQRALEGVLVPLGGHNDGVGKVRDPC